MSTVITLQPVHYTLCEILNVLSEKLIVVHNGDKIVSTSNMYVCILNIVGNKTHMIINYLTGFWKAPNACVKGGGGGGGGTRITR